MLNHYSESAADFWKMDEFRIHKDRYLPFAPLFTLSALKVNNGAKGKYLSLCILNSSIFQKSAADSE